MVEHQPSKLGVAGSSPVGRSMARVCEICGKGPMTGHKISHSHRLTKRKFYPNLRKAKVRINGTVRVARVCTKCYRKYKVL